MIVIVVVSSFVVLVVSVVIPVVIVKTKEGFEVDHPNLTPADDEIVVALFWADWCPHCVSFKPTYEKVADALGGSTTKQSGKKLRFEKVDCVALAPLAKKYGVQGYPTIKIINGPAASDMDEYEGSREEHEFSKYLSTL